MLPKDAKPYEKHGLETNLRIITAVRSKNLGLDMCVESLVLQAAHTGSASLSFTNGRFNNAKPSPYLIAPSPDVILTCSFPSHLPPDIIHLPPYHQISTLPHSTTSPTSALPTPKPHHTHQSTPTPNPTPTPHPHPPKTQPHTPSTPASTPPPQPPTPPTSSTPHPENTMSMNDVNFAPGNTGNPIKGATEGADTQALGGGRVADTPSLGDGTGASGLRREEELRSKAPQLEEREEVEQGEG